MNPKKAAKKVAPKKAAKKGAPKKAAKKAAPKKVAKKATRGRPPAISSARKTFDAARADALVLLDLGRSLDKTRLSDELVELGFSRAKGRLIVAQGFLRLMGAWEQFVEGLLLRFLAGAKTASGKPTLLGAPYSTLDAAFAAVVKDPLQTRTANYTSWTQWTTVEKRAKRFFAQGEPFASVLAPTGADADWYALGLAVRNRVAHPSDNASQKFIQAARGYKNVAVLRRGYSVGEFLLEDATAPFAAKHASKSVFQATADSMMDLADALMA